VINFYDKLDQANTIMPRRKGPNKRVVALLEVAMSNATKLGSAGVAMGMCILKSMEPQLLV